MGITYDFKGQVALVTGAALGCNDGLELPAIHRARDAEAGWKALFYRDFGYSRGLIRLGRIDGSVNVLEADGPLTARIERCENPE